MDNVKDKKILAIFGGSFNPPLISHITLAENIVNNLEQVEKVIFVPVNTKYAKPGLIDNEHRYNMLKLSCKGDKRLEVSRTEIDSKIQPYTLETLEKFEKENPEKEICFITGSDNLKQFNNWYKPEEILKKFRIIVLERNYDNVQDIINNSTLLKKYRKRIITLDNMKKIKLSSTSVRKRIKENKSIEHLVSNEVEEYIRKNKLYV